MAPHKYGRYLHILTPADGAHGGPLPWEGITGRVKYLLQKQTDNLEGQLKDEMQAQQKKMEGQLGEVKHEIRAMDAKMDAILEILNRLGPGGTSAE